MGTIRTVVAALAFGLALLFPAAAQSPISSFPPGVFSNQAALGGTPPFSPASLNPNWWFEARASTLYQSNGGSTPATANSDPVGYVSDLSGNSFTITSRADDTTRPTLQGVGSFPYLSCDGSNDMLIRDAGLNGWSAGSTTWVVAFRGVSAAAGTYVLTEGNSATTNTIFTLLKVHGSTATSSAGFYRDDAGGVPTGAPNASTPTNTNVFDGNDHVAIIVDTGSAINFWLDGVAGTGIASYTHSGTFTINRFSLCAQYRGSTPTIGLWWAGRVYGALIIDGYAASGGDITNLTTYFTALYQ